MKSLLQLLSDNNPKDQNDFTEAEDKNSTFIDEILLLLSSRPRSYHIDNIPLVNESILNYGINDAFSSDTPRLERNAIIQSRIEMALRRFEPRLKNVCVTPGEEKGSLCSFIIDAETFNGEVRFRLVWDDVISQFSLRD
ncbi:GPW/gp25 family protein [Rahnella sp. C60]|uniref:GPW/gp25 family protein n=1 Tax=Rahnella perminowiae TaxID=2816244 RepID=UPI001C2598B1|nr:GPW/gp25 family protein [Rahnella perminowiae]MBU9809459.1 GPW/gp25 family protein [Rahnella perminowiae]MBU9816227.1 GPW/gp25 family protein [Rahnella perminowiae]